MKELKFDKNRSRVKLCPCGKSNKDHKFVPYVGYTDKGYCHGCDETFLPELPEKETQPIKCQNPKTMKKIQQKPISYIPLPILKSSLKNYDKNNFITFLTANFGETTTNQLIEKYFIATSKHWQGATAFYQIDLEMKIRTAKVMLYNAETGKRQKQPFDHINWLHCLLKIENFNLSQCLFGEHLLSDNTKTVAIVESEKTAIIASVYFPHFIWLATGGKNNMKPDLFKNLQNRKTIFYPDLKAFELWTDKAKELVLNNYAVSDLLETKASEVDKSQGLDLADYLLKFNYRHFRLKALIKLQFSTLHPECWILNRETNLSLTDYNLHVLCDNLNITYNIDITPDEYYTAYQ